MRTSTKKELTKILELHQKWLNNENDGRYADLRYADLRYADLRGANLTGANLTGADLTGADLRGANLTGANLTGANLTGANLTGADLRGANLTGADLRGTNLTGADLRNADLRNANLTDANLRYANLENISINESTTGITNFCPDGSFVAWKKLQGNVIAKLLIPEHAKRSNATTLKCRASEAQVLQILKKENDTWLEIGKGVSRHDSDFIYEVGKTVKVDNFDDDRWIECSTGIHFFIDRKVAEQY